MTSAIQKINGCVVVSEVVGLVLEMLHNTASVYPSLPARHSFLGHKYFVNKISGILFSIRHVSSLDVYDNDERITNTLLPSLRQCLLDMEYALTGGEFQLLYPDWYAKRRNLNWKLYCLQATTFSKMAVCSFALYQSMNWKELTEINCPLDVSKVSNYVPKQIQSFVPKTGQRALFFGDAYVAGGEGCNPVLDCWGDIPSEIVVCDVLGVKHYKGWSMKGRIPYAKVILQVCGCDNTPNMSLQVLPPKDDSRRLNRLLNLVVFVLLASPESVPFSSAVSVKDCPNYYDIIATPMHLGEIQNKITNCTYDNLSEFTDDIELIRTNCIRYCSEAYPSLLPMVEKLCATALDLSRRLVVDFTESLCVSSTEKMFSTNQNLIGSTFVISVPLNSAEYDSYLVPIDKYERSVATEYRLEDSFYMYKKEPLIFEGETDDPSYTVTKRKGVIVGYRASNSSHSPYVPWKCLEVEWDEEDATYGLFGAVNPWDIVLSTK